MPSPDEPTKQSGRLLAPQKFNVFGYEIGEWSSGLALVLSIIGLVWQATSWFIGADIALLPFRTLEFTCPLVEIKDVNGERVICNTERPYLVLAVSRLNVVNSGSDGYDTFIDAGQVKIDFLNKNQKSLKSVTLQALYFSNRTDRAMLQESATPLYIKAGSVSSKEVEYYPRKLVNVDGTIDRRNFLDYEEFKKIISLDNGQDVIDTIEVTLIINETENEDKKYQVKCKIIVDSDFRKNSANSEVLNFIRDCVQ